MPINGKVFFSDCGKLQPFIPSNSEGQSAFIYKIHFFFVPLRRFSAKNFGRPDQYAEIFITVILNVKIDIVSIFRVSMTSNKKVIDL